MMSDELEIENNTVLLRGDIYWERFLILKNLD